MGETYERHRPLMAGIRVHSHVPGSGQFLPGTLTGAATRHLDRKTVLVTNLHVMTENVFRPDRNAVMYQPGPEPNSGTPERVGKLVYWAPIDYTNQNKVDAAIVEPDDPGIVSHQVHNANHDLGIIVPGVKEPEENMEVTVVGAVGGNVTATVRQVNVSIHLDPVYDPATRRLLPHGYSETVYLEATSGPLFKGDSGAPVLYQESPGLFRMVGIIFIARLTPADSQFAYAMKASLVESELGITFGDQPDITVRNTHNRGNPILTSEGLVGRRMVVNDYFEAGEILHAGDVAVVRQLTSPSPSLPGVYKASGDHKQRVVGIVHTSAGKQVGDVMATAGQPVPIVVRGIAKALSGGGLNIGDPVASSATRLTVPGKGRVAAVVSPSAGNPDILGKCLTQGTIANRVIDVLVNIGGTAA